MKKDFVRRVKREGIVNTRKYCYAGREAGGEYTIRRIDIDLQDSTAMRNWQIVYREPAEVDKHYDCWPPVTKDGHAIRKGDTIRTKNNNNLFEEVYDVDFDFVLTRGVFFDNDIDDWRMGPLTYVSRQELMHYTWG